MRLCRERIPTVMHEEPKIYAKGELMAMRFYNRRLTGPERLLNAKLDAIRYLGEKPPRANGLCVIIR